MTIGIDISQIVYEGTGVARYVRKIVENLLKSDTGNKYVLFGSSFRQRQILQDFKSDMLNIRPDVKIIILPFPPIFWDFIWNRLHIIPIEFLLGKLDVFWSSDWTQPPIKDAIGITTVHDLVSRLYPDETHNLTEISLRHKRIAANIVAVQERRLHRVKDECDIIFCDSQATMDDLKRSGEFRHKILYVVYPGI